MFFARVVFFHCYMCLFPVRLSPEKKEEYIKLLEELLEKSSGLTNEYSIYLNTIVESIVFIIFISEEIENCNHESNELWEQFFATLTFNLGQETELFSDLMAEKSTDLRDVLTKVYFLTNMISTTQDHNNERAKEDLYSLLREYPEELGG